MQTTTLAEMLDTLADGARVFLPGASGWPAGVEEALQTARRRLEIVTTAIPGVNSLDFSLLSPAVTVTGLFAQPAFGEAQRRGAFRHTPMSYASFRVALEHGPAFDAVIMQVAPPDADGRCSLGPAVEFTALAAARARRLFAVVNASTPRLPTAPSFDIGRFAGVCETEAPLASYISSKRDEVAEAVAANVATLISDRATLQLGLGKTPAALAGLLADRKGLSIWSGMISDGVVQLLDAGAVAPGACRACIALGGAEFYAGLGGRDDIDMCGAEVTHDPRRLLELDRLIAVNGALEVDLFGQCNLERQAGRAVSGAGGAPDFARAARLSPNGLSIVALPAEAGGASRIAPVIGEAGLVTLPRTEIDVLVTEHGVADLRGKSVLERGEAILAIAAPARQPALEAAWRTLRERL